MSWTPAAAVVEQDREKAGEERQRGDYQSAEPEQCGACARRLRRRRPGRRGSGAAGSPASGPSPTRRRRSSPRARAHRQRFPPPRARASNLSGGESTDRISANVPATAIATSWISAASSANAIARVTMPTYSSGAAVASAASAGWTAACARLAARLTLPPSRVAAGERRRNARRARPSSQASALRERDRTPPATWSAKLTLCCAIAVVTAGLLAISSTTNQRSSLSSRRTTAWSSRRLSIAAGDEPLDGRALERGLDHVLELLSLEHARRGLLHEPLRKQAVGDPVAHQVSRERLHDRPLERAAHRTRGERAGCQALDHVARDAGSSRPRRAWRCRRGPCRARSNRPCARSTRRESSRERQRFHGAG